MRTFYTVWVGQLVSLVGTSLTSFALAIYVFLETGSATHLSWILLAGQLPQILVTPLAGALVDRWDRRMSMLLADAGAGAGTLVIALLVIADRLEIWHLVIILAVSGVFQAFQWPAYTAATTLLVPKERYTRAAGLVQLADALAHVAAPAIAGALLAVGGLGTVILIDVVTFLFAIGTLLAVRFPRPEVSAAGAEGTGSLWSETRFGFRYIRQRSGLLALLLYFAVLNLVFGFLGVVVFPLVLGFASEQAMGTIFSIGAVGMVVGSIVMSAWGGPKRLMLGIMGSTLLLSAGLVALGLRPNVALAAVAAFVAFLALPVANSSSQALWQRKVDPDVQGRVFAVRKVLAQIAGPVALVAAGPLLDHVFEPMLAADGVLAGTVGRVIGTGAGRGAAFFMILTGVAAILVTAVAWLYPQLRNLEDTIPDAVPDGASVDVVEEGVGAAAPQTAPTPEPTTP